MIDRALDWVFQTDPFMPHGFCLLWRPDLVWTHVLSDAAIAIAYFTIPLFLVTLARRRRDLKFTWPFYLFGIFILLCGTTHVLNIVAFWIPIYGLEAVVKAATGIASVATALAVWPLLPKLLSLPSHDELHRLNQELETRVAARTEEVERANGQLKVLLQEVHHRVKNNLQVIASMLRLQQRHFDDDGLRAALDRSIGRVQAMSLVHDMLYSRSDLARVKAGDYLRKLIEYMRGADPRTASVVIDVKADATALPIDMSVPLALVANEIITNALKHAFPEGTSGRIEVDIATVGDKVRFAVRDDGVGSATAADAGTGGFGLRIAQALAGQLGGKAVLEAPARGTSFVLEFPAPPTTDPEPKFPRPRPGPSPAGAMPAPA